MGSLSGSQSQTVSNIRRLSDKTSVKMVSASLRGQKDIRSFFGVSASKSARLHQPLGCQDATNSTTHQHQCVEPVVSAGSCVDKSMKQEDVCDKGMKSVFNDDSVVSQECVFKKGGWCLLHERFGEKVLLRSRKWTKLGTGLCGYKLSKKVSWRCRGLSLNDVDNSDSTVSDSLEFSVSRGNRAVDIGSC